MQILFGVFDGIAHRFPSKGKKKMRLMARNSCVSNTKKTGCITAAGPQKLESYKKIKLFICFSAILFWSIVFR